MGFHVAVLMKTFPLMYNYQCRTDIDEAKVVSAIQLKSNYNSIFNLELF